MLMPDAMGVGGGVSGVVTELGALDDFIPLTFPLAVDGGGVFMVAELAQT